jgi:Asp-tRNA(Asn)/Glu-tRNA(Gln) amidotransferase C subunit
MNINTKYDIGSLLKYAKLSRLAPQDLSPNDSEEIQKFLSFFREKDFNEIIEMINCSFSTDVDGIESNLLFFKGQKTLLRDDKTSNQRNSVNDIMKNSKNNNGDYFI